MNPNALERLRPRYPGAIPGTADLASYAEAGLQSGERVERELVKIRELLREMIALACEQCIETRSASSTWPVYCDMHKDPEGPK